MKIRPIVSPREAHFYIRLHLRSKNRNYPRLIAESLAKERKKRKKRIDHIPALATVAFHFLKILSIFEANLNHHNKWLFTVYQTEAVQFKANYHVKQQNQRVLQSR
jgi:hypothetical protein